jgi:TorA maturation chaperone TorD
VTRDLAERATNRAAFAGMAGALLLSEPGAALGDALKNLPQLAQVVESISSIEYERVFLRGAPPYESIFRSDSGQRGGAVAAKVVDSYAEIGFTEHEGGGWRVAGPDHLGLELRAHAHLVALEAAAWRDERPDEGARMVETQRRFFAEHLVWWAEIALEALREAAGDGAYADLIEEVRSFVADEVELLRPAPLLEGETIQPVPHPGRLGPSRLAKHMLAPSRSGVWLSSNRIAESAHALGFPWRPMDGRNNLTPLVAAANDAGELDVLVAPWLDLAQAELKRHRERVQEQPGAERVWANMEQLAESTVGILSSLSATLTGDSDVEIVVRVSGSDRLDMVRRLDQTGLNIEVIEEI